jgi:cardiolipin synthase
LGVALALPVPVEPAEPFGDRVELLDGGREAYPRMLAAIEAAHSSIYLEVYGFSPTGWGAKFIDALLAARTRGIGVRVIVDGWGSLLGGRSVAARLRAGGCEVKIYNRFLALLVFRLRRDHRKILLVDDEIAFLGGINIGDEYAETDERDGWADLALRIQGPACARLGKRLRHEHIDAWTGAVHIYLSGESGSRRLRKRYLKAFARAQRRIRLAHAYFLPDAGLIRALRRAAQRGVEVTLLLAGRSDVPFARAATMSLYRKLLTAGVRIFEWTTSVLHAKAATVDGRQFLVGSFNLDPLSLANLETLVEVDDALVTSRADAWIDEHLSKALAVMECHRAWHQRILTDPLQSMAARLAQLLGRLLSWGQLRRRVKPPT